MGMFDSLRDKGGKEWQTKAFACDLDVYEIGDPIPADSAGSYQVEILGSERPSWDAPSVFVDSLATIRNGVLVAIDDYRDPSVPLLNYSGHIIEASALPAAAATEGDTP